MGWNVVVRTWKEEGEGTKREYKLLIERRLKDVLLPFFVFVHKLTHSFLSTWHNTYNHYWLKTDCFFKKLMKCPTYKTRHVSVLYLPVDCFEVILSEYREMRWNKRKEWRKIAACFPAMVASLHHHSRLFVCETKT